MSTRNWSVVARTAFGAVGGGIAGFLIHPTWLALIVGFAVGVCSGFSPRIWKEIRRGRHRKAEEDRGDPGPSAGGGPLAGVGSITIAFDPADLTTFRTITTTGTRPSLTTERQEEPIRAWRAATIELEGRSFRFSALIPGHGSYGIEAEAQCHRNSGYRYYMFGTGERPIATHAPPHEDCQCGFYAFAEQADAVAFARDHRHGVVLESDLFGRVIVHERGFRAQKQRVLSVAIPKECIFCTATPLPAVPFEGGPVVFVCDEHRPSDHVTVAVSALSSKLGTEIRRAGDDRD